MKLTLKEQERLTIFGVAEIARRRWKRGVKLNYIEATAIICDELLERARSGGDSLADLISLGSKIISKEDVMEGSENLIPMIQLEVMLPDGNKLLTVHEPIRLEKQSDAISKEQLLSLDY
ncbi:MAG: urease subunit gamma [Clostridiales Family XIII bacterium]|jgi:urease gamma subunit|nr:urease subunit gamma [Clostridiales Family XIII bacterium]